MLSFDLTEKNKEKLQNFENKLIDYYTLLKNLSTGEIDALKKYARVSNIGASARIENAQLTDMEINWIDTILTTTSFYYK